MKKGEVGQFKATWWKTSKPKSLSNVADKLELALKAYEMGFAKLKSTPSEDQKKATLDLLDNVEAACDKVVAEAKKAKSDAEMLATVQALEKLDFKGERAEIEAEAAKADKGEEDDVGDLGDPKAYAAVLRKGLNKARMADPDKPAKFGFAVGASRKDDRLALSMMGAARELAVKAGKSVGSKKITFGTAIASPDDANKLELNIVGAMLPGLGKKMRGLFKRYKPQPFSDVVLKFGGEVIQEEADPDDLEPEEDDGQDAVGAEAALAKLRAEMQALGDRLRAAAVAAPDRRVGLSEQGALFRSAIGAQNVAGATAALASLRKLIEEIETQHPGAGKPNAETLDKFSKVWSGSGDKVKVETDKLRSALDKEFGQTAQGAEVLKAFDARVVEVDKGIMKAELAAALAQAATAAKSGTSPDEVNKLVADAKEKAKQVRAYLEQPLVRDLDNNPFLPLTIGKIMTTALGAVEPAL